jgi:hypothetical protein
VDPYTFGRYKAILIILKQPTEFRKQNSGMEDIGLQLTNRQTFLPTFLTDYIE